MATKAWGAVREREERRAIAERVAALQDSMDQLSVQLDRLVDEGGPGAGTHPTLEEGAIALLARTEAQTAELAGHLRAAMSDTAE